MSEIVPCSSPACSKNAKYNYNNHIYCLEHFKTYYTKLYNFKIIDIKDFIYYSINFQKTKKYNKYKMINEILQLNINEHMMVIKELGKGSFGTVFSIMNKSNNKKYALKITFFNNKNLKKSKLAHRLLYLEYKHYDKLWNIKNKYISKMVLPINMIYKSEQDNYSYLLLEFFNNTLTDKIMVGAFDNNKHLNKIKYIIIKLIKIINILHNNNLIYNDIKPDNIMFDDKNNIKLIDFGLCTRYLTSNTNNTNLKSSSKSHIEKKHIGIHGNVRFSSIDGQKGFTTSRISDMESIGYLFIFLYDYNFNIFVNNKQSEDVLFKKQNMINSNEFKSLPLCIQYYFHELKNYDFYSEPNYTKFIEIIKLY